MPYAKVGEMTVYVAAPATDPRAAIIVVPEIFGINPGIRQKCERLAEVGYLAVAPEIFWRSFSIYKLIVTVALSALHAKRGSLASALWSLPYNSLPARSPRLTRSSRRSSAWNRFPVMPSSTYHAATASEKFWTSLEPLTSMACKVSLDWLAIPQIVLALPSFLL